MLLSRRFPTLRVAMWGERPMEILETAIVTRIARKKPLDGI